MVAAMKEEDLDEDMDVDEDVDVMEEGVAHALTGVRPGPSLWPH